MKKWMLGALLVLFAMASNAYAGLQPQELAESVTEKTIAKLKSDKALIAKEPERLYSLIQEYVLPHFDFERMSRWVLGKYWRQASATEKSQFINEFRALLVRTYATSLSDFAEQKIVFMPFRGDLASGEVVVRSEVEQPGSFPIPIHYRVHKAGNEWKVYDVLIDDISLISNYRTSFAREIRSSGMAGLLKQLADKNKKAMQ